MLLIVALPAGGAKPVPQDNSTSNYVYCVLIDNVHSAIYFSNIFPGYPAKNSFYRDAFHDYIQTVAPRVYGYPECSYADSILAARRKKDNMASHIRGAYRNFLETGWSY